MVFSLLVVEVGGRRGAMDVLGQLHTGVRKQHIDDVASRATSIHHAGVHDFERPARLSMLVHEGVRPRVAQGHLVRVRVRGRGRSRVRAG